MVVAPNDSYWQMQLKIWLFYTQVQDAICYHRGTGPFLACRLLNRPQTVLIEAFLNFDISTFLYEMGKSKWMFYINGSSVWKQRLAEMYIFIVCLKQFEPQQSWSGFKFWATYIHMICSEFERLIKYELRGPQSLPGLCCGNRPALKYWLAVTKLLSLESVFTVFMTLKITSRFSETAQIKEKNNIPLPSICSLNNTDYILTRGAQRLSG